VLRLMWSKIVASAAGLLAMALAVFLCLRLVTAYGDARRAAGRAEAEVAQLPAILAANAAAARAEIRGRDNVLAADQRSADELARILPLVLAANEKVSSYAQTATGRIPCLDADRVRGIETDRAALFPTARDTPEGFAGPVPADVLADAARP